MGGGKVEPWLAPGRMNWLDGASRTSSVCDPSSSSNQTSWRKANLTCKLAIDNLEKAELLQGGDSLRQRYHLFVLLGLMSQYHGRRLIVFRMFALYVIL